MASTTRETLPSVPDLLKSTHSWLEDGQCRWSLGNPAGDADSIISAIGIAYVDTYLYDTPTIPIVSICLEDLKTQRPETKYLLQLAGISDWNDFIAVDNIEVLPQHASITLVDHNQLTLDKPDWSVRAIWDHHYDEGAHSDTCSGDARQVAFNPETSAALVASTCTLMVERFALNKPDGAMIPPSLSILLMGVILLDSLNLSPQAGKVTERDRVAIQSLQAFTDWKSAEKLNWPTDILQPGPTIQPDLTKLFETLQSQKFHPDFWNSLTTLQALKLDYKSFDASAENGQEGVTFGISAVLQTMSDFWSKPAILQTMLDYLKAKGLSFFGIMFMAVVDGTPQRQMILASPNEQLLDSLVDFLQQEGSLHLQIVEQRKDPTTGLRFARMNQGNVKASRKQVVPVLMAYYKQESKL